MVAAAIIGGAVVGAAGTAVAGHQAAGATQAGTNASIKQQQRTLDQQATLSAPYRDFGESAIPQLRALLGLPPAPAAGAPQPASPGAPPTLGSMPGYGGVFGRVMSGAPNGIRVPGGTNPSLLAPPGGAPAAAGPTPASMTETLRNMPGYQFAKSEGVNSVANKASSMGLALSGNTLRGIDEFSTGLADSTYQEEVGNLQSVVGMGQAAAAGQATNVGTAGSNISNALINQGNNMANIDVNTGAGISKAIGGAANEWAQYQTLQDIYDFYGPPRKVRVKHG